MGTSTHLPSDRRTRAACAQTVCHRAATQRTGDRDHIGGNGSHLWPEFRDPRRHRTALAVPHNADRPAGYPMGLHRRVCRILGRDREITERPVRKLDGAPPVTRCGKRLFVIPGPDLVRRATGSGNQQHRWPAGPRARVTPDRSGQPLLANGELVRRHHRESGFRIVRRTRRRGHTEHSQPCGHGGDETSQTHTSLHTSSDRAGRRPSMALERPLNVTAVTNWPYYMYGQSNNQRVARFG